MHGIKIPFTGMIVSCLSVTCIILIAYYIPVKNSIIKATILVALFKMLLSPHSPPTAYLAVFFQGCLGQLLFYNKRFFKISAITLSVLALVESAGQRILVLMIVYGNDFWYAVDSYIKKLTGGNNIYYSKWLAISYILLHAITGVFIGIFAVRLAEKSDAWRSNQVDLIFNKNATQTHEDVKSGNKKTKWFFIFLWLVLVLLFVHAYLDPANSVLPAGDVLRIILRTILIVLSWYLVIAPLIMGMIKRGLRLQQIKQQLAVSEIIELIPRIKYIFTKSWLLSANEKGIKRIKLFIKILFVNVLSN